MNRFQFVLHIYNTYNYLLHITFISPGVKYPFKKVPLPSREERGGSHQPLKVPLRKGTPKAVVLNLFWAKAPNQQPHSHSCYIASRCQCIVFIDFAVVTNSNEYPLSRFWWKQIFMNIHDMQMSHLWLANSTVHHRNSTVHHRNKQTDRSVCKTDRSVCLSYTDRQIYWPRKKSWGRNGWCK